MMLLENIRERVVATTHGNLHEQRHLLDTEQKVLALDSNASDRVRIAALGHDIDRSIPAKKITYDTYNDYELYKKAHALQSASIMRDLLWEYGVASEDAQRVYDLIAHHERKHPADQECNLLMTADSLSFFDCNLEDYKKTHPDSVTREKIQFMYTRMIPQGKTYIQTHLPGVWEEYIKDFYTS